MRAGARSTSTNSQPGYIASGRGTRRAVPGAVRAVGARTGAGGNCAGRAASNCPIHNRVAFDSKYEDSSEDFKIAPNTTGSRLIQETRI